MFLEVWCTHCNVKLRVKEQLAGKSIRCPKCSGVFVAQDAPLVEPDDSPAQHIQAPAPVPRPAAPRPAPGAVSREPLPAPKAPPPLPVPGRPKRPRPADDEDEDEGLVADFPAVEFNAMVKKDPEKAIKGVFKAKVTAEGLRLGQGKKLNLVLPVGTPAQYLDGNKIALDIDGREVVFQIVKFGSYQARLARDLVAFLSGRRRVLYKASYGLEWYLFVPAVLPLGIPILTLGGMLPCAIGFGLGAGCLAIAQIESLPKGLRIALSILLGLVGYLIVGILIWLAVSGRWIGNQRGEIHVPDFQPAPRLAERVGHELAAAPQRPPRLCPGVLAAVQHQPPVHHDVLDSLAVLERVGVGRPVDHAPRVEHRHVGVVPRPQQAAVVQPQLDRVL